MIENAPYIHVRCFLANKRTNSHRPKLDFGILLHSIIPSGLFRVADAQWYLRLLRPFRTERVKNKIMKGARMAARGGRPSGTPARAEAEGR